MNELEAYKAMVKFLEKYYNRTKSDDIASLLGDMILIEAEKTADPAAWEDWLESIKD